MNKRLIILIFTTLFPLSIVLAQPPTRQLEVTYPAFVPGVSPPVGQVTVSRYIYYIYTAAIALGGLVALGSIIIGGFRYLTSTGNPGAMADARERIFYGILGLLILLGSYVLLREINPEILSVVMPPMQGVGPGIIAYSDRNCGNGANGTPGVYEPVPPDIVFERVVNQKSLGNRIMSVQSFWAFEGSNDITIEFYPNPQCTQQPIVRYPAGSGQRFDPNTCVQINVVNNVRCIKIIRHVPGVHLFTQQGARLGGQTGFEYILKNSDDSLPEPINDNVRTIALVTDAQTSPPIQYGAILQRDPGPRGNPRGWATIWLPDEYRTQGSDQDRLGSFSVTYYNVNPDDVSSVVVFKVVREQSDDFWIQICAGHNCEPRPGCPGMIRIFPWRNEYRKARWVQSGNNYVIEWGNAQTITTTIDRLRGITGTQASHPEEIVRGIPDIINSFQSNWCDQNSTSTLPIEEGSASGGAVEAEKRPNGVSAIKIHPEAKYIVILNDRRDAVAQYPAMGNPSVITSSDIDALNQVGFDNATGSIIVIRGEIL